MPAAETARPSTTRTPSGPASSEASSWTISARRNRTTPSFDSLACPVQRPSSSRRKPPSNAIRPVRSGTSSPSQASSAAEPRASARAASPAGRNARLPEPKRFAPGASSVTFSSVSRGDCQANSPRRRSTSSGAAPGRSKRAGPAATVPREPPRTGCPSRPIPSTSTAKRCSRPWKRTVPSATRRRRSREKIDRSSGPSGASSGGVSESVTERLSASIRTGRISPASSARRERRIVPPRSDNWPTSPEPPRSVSPWTRASARTNRSDRSSISTSPPSSFPSCSTSSSRKRFSVQDDETTIQATRKIAAKTASTIARAWRIRRTRPQPASRCSRSPFR